MSDFFPTAVNKNLVVDAIKKRTSKWGQLPKQFLSLVFLEHKGEIVFITKSKSLNSQIPVWQRLYEFDSVNYFDLSKDVYLEKRWRHVLRGFVKALRPKHNKEQWREGDNLSNSERDLIEQLLTHEAKHV